jgi:HEAT repeat protein
MFRKHKKKKKIKQVINDKYSNWLSKSKSIDSLFKQDEELKEIYMDLLEKDKDEKLRKGLASVLGYLDYSDIVPELVKLLFKEKDWMVRFAIARSSAKISDDEAVKMIKEEFKKLTKEAESTKDKIQLKITFAEALGVMQTNKSRQELHSLFSEQKNKQLSSDNLLLLQIIYGLGEVGDESTIELLQQFTNHYSLRDEKIKDSINHALRKIVQRLGFSSFKSYQEQQTRN